jgi:hypothetical protein
MFFFPFPIKSIHFNGGTITWSPIDPHSNSSTVIVTITQTYAWTSSHVNCSTDVPISTPNYNETNVNLTCISDCSNDGNYSMNPVDILTDCTSSSSSLNIMTSQRSKNVTLTIGAHFQIGYTDGDWRPLENGIGSQWSIVSLINLRRRPDGILNTPPVPNVVSPQFVIVNETKRIRIPFTDINPGDNIRCRWAEKNK